MLEMITPEGQDFQTVQRRKKLKLYAKYCILVVVGVLAVFVVPGYYVLRTSRNSAGQKGGNLTRVYTPLENKTLPWYLPHGKKTNPQHGSEQHDDGRCRLWPKESESDRIIDQLTCSPSTKTGKTKLIVIVDSISEYLSKFSVHDFSECPVSNCKISDRIEEAENADAVLLSDAQTLVPNFSRKPDQIWILHVIKSPFHSKKLTKLSGLINWTATYRSDSDLVSPYGFWVYYNKDVKEFQKPNRNFATKKTKKAVWFVADCHHDHNGRKRYVDDLKKYIGVDIFGKCNDHSCPCKTRDACLKFLSKYKFYISFENVNCIDYITEKFFFMLKHDILPVVMGARPEDYARVAPMNSYIHVDNFTSPKELGDYLNKLDQNDDLYNSYFKWKGTGEVTDSRFFCRLCTMLHSDYPNKSYDDLQQWWANHSCIEEDSWSRRF